MTYIVLKAPLNSNQPTNPSLSLPPHSPHELWRCSVLLLQVSAVADRPAWRSDSCPPCYTQISTVSVINWWPRPSPVHHTDWLDRPPKLIAPETISRSRDMVGAHQNFNGSRDLTTPLSGTVCHPWASTCYLLRSTYPPNLKSMFSRFCIAPACGGRTDTRWQHIALA